MNGQGLVNSTDLMWKVLRSSVQDPRAGSIIIVLDALDECAESEFAQLMDNVRSQFRGGNGYGRLKYLLTCRPYDQILSKFQFLLDDFPNIRIPGEEESEAISREVDRVIKYRVDQLAIERQLSPQVKSSLEQRLQNTRHRTYLWVYLVFNYLAEGNYKKTPKGITAAIALLPKSVNEAYEQILTKTNQSPVVRKSLCIVLAAGRPLTLSEMNVAVNVDDRMQSMDELDLEDDEDFKGRLRSWCGLFISVHQGSIYFLHQTAREFLLADLESPTSIPSGLRWHHSITKGHAHNVLAIICVLYLNLLNSKGCLSTDTEDSDRHFSNQNSFLPYAAENWIKHFRKADVAADDTIIPFARRICDTSSKACLAWFNTYTNDRGRRITLVPTRSTELMVASYVGLPVIVKVLLEGGANMNNQDNDMTALYIASWQGHETVVKLLLEHGADIDMKSPHDWRTPLDVAIKERREIIVNLLIQNGANIKLHSGIYDQTPLHVAIECRSFSVTKLLLEKGANIEEKDNRDWTPLLTAIYTDDEPTVRLLLEKGADINSMNAYGETPLRTAVENNYNASIIRLLVESGAWLEVDRIYDTYTVLTWASERRDEDLVRVLLDNGARIEFTDEEGRTALSRAYAWARGYNAIVDLLLQRGARRGGRRRARF